MQLDARCTSDLNNLLHLIWMEYHPGVRIVGTTKSPIIILVDLKTSIYHPATDRVVQVAPQITLDAHCYCVRITVCLYYEVFVALQPAPPNSQEASTRTTYATPHTAMITAEGTASDFHGWFVLFISSLSFVRVFYTRMHRADPHPI